MMKFAGNKKSISFFLIVTSMTLVSGIACAQQPVASRMSAGVIMGNPLGATMQYRMGLSNAVDVGFGPDYFGSPRLQMDYVWQFHAFPSRTVGEYFGPGLAVAFGQGISTFY
ncbi:MAG: hypothetical protein ACHQNE_05135, partial [Candidatus Kapaibacterium sp.]